MSPRAAGSSRHGDDWFGSLLLDRQPFVLLEVGGQVRRLAVRAGTLPTGHRRRHVAVLNPSTRSARRRRSRLGKDRKDPVSPAVHV
jgi:hypothetical protein